MAGEIHVRPFGISDAEATAKIFFAAVRQGTVNHYNEEQRMAWAVAIPDIEPWTDRLMHQTCFVAERDGQLTGFMTIDTQGYIDLAFAHPAGLGTGRRLYQAIEAVAKARGFAEMTTQASLMAKPFFEHLGWRVITEQTIVRHGVELNNVRMAKRLADAGTQEATETRTG